MEILVLGSKEELAIEAERIFLERFVLAGRLSVALSGGTTPGPAYRRIAALPVDWSAVDVWWVDERFVDPSDPESNERLGRETWLKHIPIPTDHVHPMYRAGTPEEAALAYEGEWQQCFGNGGVDLAFMGVGPDGHTASIFPGNETIFESDRLVAPTVSPAGVAQRITLTPKALERCHELVILVTGVEKAPYVKGLAEGTGDWPACRVARAAKRVTLLTDTPAAREIAR